MLGDYDVFLTPEFFRALVLNAGLTVHLDLIRGDNPHHIVEAAFKAFARALDGATSLDSARDGRALDQGRAVIVVVDYGVNNLKSVVRALAAGGHEARLTTDPDEVRRADHVADARRRALRAGLAHLDADRPRRRGARGGAGAARPVMGICLGLQLFFATSAEAPEAPGLGLLPGRVVRFDDRPARAARRLGAGGADGRRARRHPVLARGVPRRAAVLLPRPQLPPGRAARGRRAGHRRRTATCSRRSWATGNVLGAQFHPEKSQRAGIELLDAFARWRP